jgi:hypothetical protein
MEIPSTPVNEKFTTSKLLLENIKEEKLERKFFRKGNNTSVEIFEPQDGYAAVVTEFDEQGNMQRQSVFTEQDGLMPVLNRTIDKENQIPEDGKIADVKDEGLIITVPSTSEYIIVPEQGEIDRLSS